MVFFIVRLLDCWALKAYYCVPWDGGIYIQTKTIINQRNIGCEGETCTGNLTKANIPLVGCRANEIENLFTAEPRVASEKEKNRYLKCITANKEELKKAKQDSKH